MLAKLAEALTKVRLGRSKFCQSAFATRISTATWSSACQASQLCNPTAQAQTTAQLQEENKKLRSKLAALRWPRLEFFRARGQVYPLPWHPQGGRLHVPGPAGLRYLSGLFDGDGCVTSSHGKYCVLSMTQSYDNAEPLLKLQDAFGGGIYRLGLGAGLTKPALQWKVGGTEVERAARQLLANSSTKRRQLELAERWPEGESERREHTLQLRLLKQYDSAVDLDCCWAYCSGFLDADGSIVISAKGGIWVRFAQKFPTVLENIQRFLAREGVTAVMYAARSAFELRIQKQSHSKLALRQMLEAGLQKKASQAQLVLDMTGLDATQVREALPQFVGNQQFGRRLDEAGLKRAAQIVQLQTQAKRGTLNGQQEEAANLAAEIHRLKGEHEFLKARLENSELHDYIGMVGSLQRSGWRNSALQESVDY